MGKETVHTDDAPPAAADYSQATVTDDLVFTAGQVALTPEGDSLADKPVDVQAEQVLENLGAVLSAADSGLDDALKTTVYFDNVDDYGAANEVYGEYFDANPPARSAVEAGNLPLGMAVATRA